MKTVEVKVYEFDELAPDVQEKVIEKNRDINTDYGWYEFVYEDAKTIAELLGIEIENIYFRGFWSQGDGAMFEGNYKYARQAEKRVREYAPNDAELHRIARELDKLQKKEKQQLSATVKHSGHYYHEYSNEITVDFGTGSFIVDGKWIDRDDEADFDAQVESKLIKLLRDFMRWIYRQLESEYDNARSREAIVSTIEANEYTFLENGKMVNILTEVK